MISYQQLETVLKLLTPDDVFGKKTAIALGKALKKIEKVQITNHYGIAHLHPTQWKDAGGNWFHGALLEGCLKASMYPALKKSGLQKAALVDSQGDYDSSASGYVRLVNIERAMQLDGRLFNSVMPKRFSMPYDVRRHVQSVILGEYWTWQPEVYTNLGQTFGTSTSTAPPVTVNISIPQSESSDNPLEVVENQVPEVAQKAKTSNRFPTAIVQNIAKKTRDGVDTGNLSPNVEISLRKMATWGKTFYGLIKESVDPEVALDVGFLVSTYWTVETEEREFLREIYYQELGRDPEVPNFIETLPEITRELQDEFSTIHPLTPLVAVMVKYAIPVWVYGRRGSGKSVGLKQALSILDIPMFRVQGATDTTGEDVLGAMGARNGSTFYEYGFLPTAMGMDAPDSDGWGLVCDEFDLFRPAVEAEFRAVLEGEPLILKGNAGELVHPGKNFRMMVSANTMGLGEATEYVGTQPINEATRDRFAFVEFPYMSREFEGKALKQSLRGFIADWSI